MRNLNFQTVCQMERKWPKWLFGACLANSLNRHRCDP
jgi:hypothetical protein